MDLVPFMEPTPFVDSRHETIIALADSLGLPQLPAIERAVRIAEYVRGSISYQFTAKLTREEYVASRVLADGRGFCVQKAVLACALGRAVGVPSAVVLCDMRDAALPPRVTMALGTDVMFHHGVSAFFIEGGWWQVDASLSPDVLAKKNVAVVPFDASGDALLPATTQDGRSHVEYLRFHDTYADLPFEQMLGAFAEAYSKADIPSVRRMGTRSCWGCIFRLHDRQSSGRGGGGRRHGDRRIRGGRAHNRLTPGARDRANDRKDPAHPLEATYPRTVSTSRDAGRTKSGGLRGS